MFIKAPDILYIESCLYIHILANFNLAMIYYDSQVLHFINLCHRHSLRYK